MPDSEITLAEITRRLTRVEDRLDARTLTLDVYNAEKTAHTVEVAGFERRIASIEESIQSMTRLLFGAFVTIIVNGLFLAITTFGKG
jgi:hypothetical protein